MEDIPDKIDYNHHVKPILSDRCYQCHGPDEETRKAGLRLDIEKEAFKRLESGKKAFVKHSPGKSEAIHRLVSDDPDYQMPPPESKLSMSNEEVAILVKWLDQGAEWKPHWSFIPVGEVDVPDVTDEYVAVNPVDNFIIQKLTSHDLSPNSEADKERLLRRVTMDLTGLPPTIEEIDAFIADNSESAYEKVVDRLLASDAHAERLTMEWMDVARYSDSHGVSFDGSRNSWPYRDWIIDAFKSNMPYDEFMTTQIAGDLLDDPTIDDLIATSFYRMGQLEASAGSIAEEFRIEYVAERTGLTGTAFLGLTVECARCHDHKFDPISQKEYYQLSAFFNTTTEMGLGPTDDDRPPTLQLFKPEERVAIDSIQELMACVEQDIALRQEELEAIVTFINNTAPETEMPGLVDSVAFDAITDFKKKKKKKKKDAEDKFEDIKIVDGSEEIEATLGVTAEPGKHGTAACFDEEYDYISIKGEEGFEMNEAFSVSAWIHTIQSEYGPSQTIIGNSKHYGADYRGWDLWLDSSRHLHARLIHRLPDDFIEVQSRQIIQADDWVHTGFTYDGTGKAEGLELYVNGSRITDTVLADCLTRTIVPIDDYTMEPDSTSIRIGKSYRLWTYDIGMFKGSIDEVRIFDREVSEVDMARLGESEQTFSRDQQYWHRVQQDEQWLSLQDSLAALRGLKRLVLDSVEEIMVMQEMAQPRPTYLLERGLYNEHGEQVNTGTPEYVLPFGDEYPQNRMGLAMWLTDPANPLTARVAINRYWQLIFGKGLVRTAEDFGNQGESPTHPELLDWLAGEFVQSSWDLRHMIKLMVMSATYRQSSHADERTYRIDPENTLYARGPSYRWPAEFIRDNALASSGLLIDSIGGPPVKPYQPDGLWLELAETSYDLASYEKDTLDALYRRSLYTFQRRFSPPPFMSVFDASDREICRMRRELTNSPLQSLFLLNDPQIVEAARILAERVACEADEPEEQIELSYRLCTSVRPTDDKMDILKDLYAAALDNYCNNDADADSLLMIGDRPWDQSLDKSQIAALTIVSSTIINSDDTYMKR